MKYNYIQKLIRADDLRFGRIPCLFLFVVAMACNGDNVPDCFQSAGDLIREEEPVPIFDRVIVFENIQLILLPGTEQKVEIETGEFLRNEVSAEVIDGTLILKDQNNCNLFREYGTTTFYVTAPDLLEIRSSTGFPIRSNGTLNYSNVKLISESFNNPETETTDGSFDLELDSQSVQVVSNGIAYFVLRGRTVNLSINIAAGDSRVEAELLTAQNVTIEHRGSNDILINPQTSLRGVISSTGDVVSFNRPPEVDVELIFNGKLIFRD